jgi:nucleoside-diphosphate-sugar epimerase
VKVVVTGASGKAGRATVQEFQDHGYDVVPVDIAPAPADTGFRSLLVDLTDYGQTLDALTGADSVVHLANIPAPGIYTAAHTFNTNSAMNSNVFLAAQLLKLQKVVWASSETTLGLPFGPDSPPRYAPIDEDHYPYPSSTYALSKVVAETMALEISRWSDIPFVALRFTNILTPEDQHGFRAVWADPVQRIWNLWSYVDIRDAAAACRNAIEAETSGAKSFVIAASDSVMNRPSADLMAEHFPGVELRGEIGEFGSLLSSEKAKRLLGYQPKHSWRQHLDG